MAIDRDEILRQIKVKLREKAWYLLQLVRGVPFADLSRFSHQLGTCYRSAVAMPQALEMSVRGLESKFVRRSWAGAADAIRAGSTLYDAFRPAAPVLPPFYMPVIRAGEKSGRLDDAFAFLETHCKLLAGPASAVRNLWLIPTVILIFGSVLEVVATAVLAPTSAIGTAIGAIVSWGRLALFMILVLATPLKFAFDRIKFVIPMYGLIERELAVHRFCRVFSMVYGVGEYRVEEMIEMAADSVDNWYAKLDFLIAASRIKSGHTIGEAFQSVKTLNQEEKTAIEMGEIAGTLEHSLEQISDETGKSLVFRVGVIQPILTRAVMYIAMLSVVGAIVRMAL